MKAEKNYNSKKLTGGLLLFYLLFWHRLKHIVQRVYFNNMFYTLNWSKLLKVYFVEIVFFLLSKSNLNNCMLKLKIS